MVTEQDGEFAQDRLCSPDHVLLVSQEQGSEAACRCSREGSA